MSWKGFSFSKAFTKWVFLPDVNFKDVEPSVFTCIMTVLIPKYMKLNIERCPGCQVKQCMNKEDASFECLELGYLLI